MDRIIIEHWIGLALEVLWTDPDPEVAEVRAADGLADARLRLERAEDLDGADADALEDLIGALEVGLVSGAMARDAGATTGDLFSANASFCR